MLFDYCEFHFLGIAQQRTDVYWQDVIKCGEILTKMCSDIASDQTIVGKICHLL